MMRKQQLAWMHATTTLWIDNIETKRGATRGVACDGIILWYVMIVSFDFLLRPEEKESIC